MKNIRKIVLSLVTAIMVIGFTTGSAHAALEGYFGSKDAKGNCVDTHSFRCIAIFF